MMSSDAKKRAARQEGWKEFSLTILYAILITLGLRIAIYEPFNIPSESMMPTLLVGDYLFVSKFSYGYSRYSLPFGLPLIPGRIFESVPKRGDVIVFKLPRDNASDYIKRIVGLPGDRIQVKGGVLYINGDMVTKQRIEDFVRRGRFGQIERIPQFLETLPDGRQYHTLDLRPNSDTDDTDVYVVPPEHYFAMGDNRDNSLDSRIAPDQGGVGFIPAVNLVGRADFLFFSTDGSARWWELWNWISAARFERIFSGIH